jgi:hypothetical protein
LASHTSQTTIINRALQLLGYKAVSSINDNDRGARAMQRCYQSVLLDELRSHWWSFSLKRVILAASATPPAFGKANYYPLPGDFLDLAPSDPTFGANGGGPISGPPPIVDWQIEGNQIATDDPSPIQVRYISSNVQEGLFDSNFAEAFAAKLAAMCCEELTQSNTKLASLGQIYEQAIERAKQRNAFENRPVQPQLDSWISARF